MLLCIVTRVVDGYFCLRQAHAKKVRERKKDPPKKRHIIDEPAEIGMKSDKDDMR